MKEKNEIQNIQEKECGIAVDPAMVDWFCNF